MGVDWYSCKSCGNTFPDCGDYVYCDKCYSKWCSEDCATDDGYIKANCKLGLEISSEGYLEDCVDDCPRYCNSENDDFDCEGCENYTPTSCNYCRKDDFEDSEVLQYILDNILNKSREEIIKLMKN